MLYQRLIEPFSENSDPVYITEKCFEADQTELTHWDEQIQGLTLAQLKESKKAILFPGYGQEDLGLLKRNLLVFLMTLRSLDRLFALRMGTMRLGCEG